MGDSISFSSLRDFLYSIPRHLSSPQSAPSNHFPFFSPFCAESPLFHQTFPFSLRRPRHQSPQVKSVGWEGRRAFVRTHAERKRKKVGPRRRRRMASRVGNFSRGRAKESPNIFELFYATIPFQGNSCQLLIVREAIHKNIFLLLDSGSCIVMRRRSGKFCSRPKTFFLAQKQVSSSRALLCCYIPTLKWGKFSSSCGPAVTKIIFPKPDSLSAPCVFPPFLFSLRLFEIRDKESLVCF